MAIETVTDLFNRTTSGNWGTGDLGEWTRNNANLSTDGTYAISTGTTSFVNVLDLADPAIWTHEDDLTFELKFQWHSTIAGTSNMRIVFFDDLAENSFEARIEGNSNLQISWYSPTDDDFVDFSKTTTASAVGYLKVHLDKTTGLVEAKYWEGAEPGTYDTSLTVPSDVIDAVTEFGAGRAGNSSTVRFDHFSISYIVPDPEPELPDTVRPPVRRSTSLTVLGRRTKQQILKDFVRPSPSVVVSGPEITIGEGGGNGDPRGCAGGGEPPPTGGSVTGEICEGRGTDYPDWDWDESASSDYPGTPINVDDGQFSATFLNWPTMPFVLDSQFGDFQGGELTMFTPCDNATVRAYNGALTFTGGEAVSDQLVYAPTTHLGTPLWPGHFASEEYGERGSQVMTDSVGNIYGTSITYSDNGLDTNREFSIAPRTEYSTKSWTGHTPTGTGYQSGALYYFSAEGGGPYPGMVGALAEQWVWVELSNVSTFPMQRRVFPTGITSSSVLPFFIFNNTGDSGPESFVQFGNVRVYPMSGFGMGGSWGFFIRRDSGTLHNESLTTDERRGSRNPFGDMSISLSFSWYAYDAEADEDNGGPAEMQLLRDAEGNYISVVTAEQIYDVLFDGIAVDEGLNYTLDLEGLNGIIPVEPLDPETIVIATVVKA